MNHLSSSGDHQQHVINLKNSQRKYGKDAALYEQPLDDNSGEVNMGEHLNKL